MVETTAMTEFEKFIRKERILIADTSRASRVGIARALSDMGAMTPQMILVDSYVWAEEVINSVKPGVVVLDYTLDSRCSLDLLQASVLNEKRLTAIISGNSSQAAVARAAEDDVDIFIAKPY